MSRIIHRARAVARMTLVLALCAAPGSRAGGQTTDARAEGASPPTRIFIGAGVGFAQGSTSIGGRTGQKGGVVFGGTLAGVRGNGLRTFSVDVHYEPFEVQNPQRDERYSSVNVIVSGYLGPVGLGLGWQQRTWSGSDIWVESDGGIALQLTLAPATGRWHGWALAPEFFMRIAGGDEIATTSFGARVLVGRLVG